MGGRRLRPRQTQRERRGRVNVWWYKLRKVQVTGENIPRDRRRGERKRPRKHRNKSS